MRLIDADALKKQIAGMAINFGYPSNKANALCELIEAQPTAYDADKVVEQLKELHKGYECTDNEFQRGAKAGAHYVLNRAIEIVEGGVVDE